MNLLSKPFTIQDLVIKQNTQTGLIAIIAIHSLRLGPALGGCRFVRYPSLEEAVLDATKLAEAMTYKSAMAGLPLGGGKAVIISHDGIADRKQIFEGFGELVDSLQGKYITATDSGTNEDDMKTVALRTQHVTSIRKSDTSADDTAAMTAIGVGKAIEAAVYYRLKKDSLKGVHVAIQGVGNVGYLLARWLAERGARITLSDINAILLAERADELDAGIASPETITTLACDVLSPCALGGVINHSVLDKIQASIICGAANNQLQDSSCGELLRQRGILYVPDYVANAGGLICAAAQAAVIPANEAVRKVQHIYQSTMDLFKLAEKMQLPTNIVANKMAESRFL